MEEEKTSSLAKQKIDNILKSAPSNAKKLAAYYLGVGRRNTEGLLNMSPLGDSKGKSIKHYLNNLYKKVEKRIGKNISDDLKINYTRGTIIEVYLALLTFEKILSTEPVFDVWKWSNDTAKARQYFGNKYKRIIKATNTLLRERCLSDTQKNVILEIKATNEAALNKLSQTEIRESTINPLQAKLLGFVPGELLSPSLNQFAISAPLNLEEQSKAYLECLNTFHFKKPKSRPKKIIENALLIVVFKLLKVPGKQDKWLKEITADLVSRFLSQTVTAKRVESALHSPA